MATVRAPALSLEASGNVGPVNYTTWKGLSIARMTYEYSDPQTTKQIVQRARLTSVAGEWGGTLTGEQRAEWDLAAQDERFRNKLKQEFRPSGYQLFMKLNLQAKFLGGILHVMPPKKPDGVYVWRMRLTSHIGDDANFMTMEKSEFVKVDADGMEIFRAGPYNSGGRRPIEPEYRFLKLETATYFYKDFDVIDTKWYWYRMRWFFETGYVGNWWEGQVLTDFQ